MFDVHQFFYRSDWPFFRPAVALNSQLGSAESFDPESFNPELTTEGLVAG
jgi:hypothetical protein